MVFPPRTHFIMSSIMLSLKVSPKTSAGAKSVFASSGEPASDMPDGGIRSEGISTFELFSMVCWVSLPLLCALAGQMS